MDFEGQVIIVTGAGNGLGRAHALLLGHLGARVVVNDPGFSVDGAAGGEAVADRVVKEILDDGGQAVSNTDSVATSNGAAAMVQTAIDAFGRIDAVVNNAGILRDRTFTKITVEEMEAVLDVHLMGSFNVCRQAWPHMKDQGYGRIVTTTSTAGLFGNFGQVNYAAAKAGIVGMTRTLAIEGEKYGIKANIVSPAASTRMSAPQLEESLREQLDPGLASPAVALLAHGSCPWNGETIAAGGGRVARIFIGETRGYATLSRDPDELLAHADEIFDMEGFATPAGVWDEVVFLQEQTARL